MSNVSDMMEVEEGDRGVDWIKDALACAIKLEHSTIPPYLCAMWSIKTKTHPFWIILHEVVLEEMGHFALASNMLVALGGEPPIGDPGFVPSYPGPLPCGITPKNNPCLVVKLVGFSVELVNDVFMSIERPDHDPIPITAAVARAMEDSTYYSIGDFYDAIRSAFLALDPAPAFLTDKQLEFQFPNPNNKVFVIGSIADAVKAIDQIREQGEGTEQSPDAEMFGMELAHYYKFEQITKSHLFMKGADGKWTFGPAIPPLASFQLRPMAEVPPEGYTGMGVPPEIDQFNMEYKAMLANLKLAWQQGGATGLATLNKAISQMTDLGTLAITAMNVKIGTGPQTYGPTFRF